MLLTLACLAGSLACDDESDGGVGGSTGNDSVLVVNNAFDPLTVTADPSGTVVWSWSSGGTAHNVTFEEAITGSGDKTSGTFSHTFSAAGVHRYRCTIHSASFTSGMRGEVVVE